MALLRISALLLTLLWAPSDGLASPLTRFSSSPADPASLESNASYPFADYDPVSVKRQVSKPPLRILALGASIVHGIGSTETGGNGFRKPLRDALRFDGWDVNMVGSKHSGNMVDWNHEATPGDVLTQIYDRLGNSLAFKPNMVVINGGTNDANGAIAPSQAGERMTNILNEIWNADGMGNTCIMLSTLIPTTVANGVIYRGTINAQYRMLVDDFAAQGKCIVLADMDPPQGPASGWISTTRDMISDGIHPNSEGHRKMAYVFYKAVNKAFKAGKISAPSGDFVVTPSGCDKVYGNGYDAGSKTQLGSGIDDDIYYHDSEGMGVILTVVSDWDRDQWRFARLYGRQRDDLVGWFRDGTVSSYGVWKNSGGGNFAKIADLKPDLDCIPKGLHFIDMNGDGYDDIVCIDGDGNAYLSINRWDGTDTTPPTFKRVSDTALIKTNEGYSQDRVRLADIDGDGRADYCILDDGGNVHCWRNDWIDDIPKFWEPLGLRFTAKGKGDIRGVRFEDINGDGRDDWMWLDDVGATETWTNARSCKKGQKGDGLNVAWRQAFHKGQQSGNTHYGVGSYGTGLRDSGRIHFGRIYSNVAAFGELPLQDYVYINHSLLDNGKHQFQFLVWKNIGGGGAKLKADGNKYCNMKGYADGRDDYVWTWSTGKMFLYPNKGLQHLDKGESFWGPVEDPIWVPPRNLDRRDLHLVDWDGDGLCDIVWVDPDNDNRVQLWRNRYKETGKWDWAYNANPAPALHCKESRGLGLHDLAVRFGDIDGNGRGDYLCIEKDGRVTGFIHNDDDSWEDVGQIKVAQDKDRANLRWADVNGDGKADMLWVDKFTGDATVWYSRGRGNPADNLGSSFHWDMTNGAVYAGNVAGTCMYYPDLDGNGRADQHSIENSLENTAETSFNPSCGLTDRTGDDSGGVVNPNLPVQPGSDDDGGDGGGDGNGNGNGGGNWPPVSYYYPNPKDDLPAPSCEPAGDYSTLDKIESQAGTIPLFCGPVQVLPVLVKMLQDATDQYNEILADHYDYYFGLYANMVSDMAPGQFYKYVEKARDDFTCMVPEKVVCCTSCQTKYPGQNCEYCDNSQCNPSSPYGEKFTHVNVSEPCPPDLARRGVTDPQIEGSASDLSVYWTLRDDQADAFFDGAVEAVGPVKDKIVFTRISVMNSHAIPPSECALDFYARESCAWLDWWLNYPQLSGFTAKDVINPKESVSKALGNTATLKDDLTDAMWRIKVGVYDGYPEDVVDAVTLPIFMVQEAITAMQNAVEIGKKIDEQNKLDFLLFFLSAIFFVIPFVGEALGSVAELASLGRVLTWIGEAGNAALDIYGVVQDPASAPLAILGLVLGVKGIRDKETATKAADLRRAMSLETLGKLSPNIARKMDQVGLVVSKDSRSIPLCIFPRYK